MNHQKLLASNLLKSPQTKNLCHDVINKKQNYDYCIKHICTLLGYAQNNVSYCMDSTTILLVKT